MARDSVWVPRLVATNENNFLYACLCLSLYWSLPQTAPKNSCIIVMRNAFISPVKPRHGIPYSQCLPPIPVMGTVKNCGCQ